MSPLDVWHSRHLDLYRFLRPLLFRCDPEQAHTVALRLLERGLGPKTKTGGDPILHTNVCGLEFRNPVGLAAGFDKNAHVIREVLDFGFGFAEIGTITPEPQEGNLRPRLFRALEAEAVINRLGFNSDGMNTCLQRIKAWHDASRPLKNKNTKNKDIRGLVGFNIGKNKESEDAATDYIKAFIAVAPYADYIAINISSPNTPGLRDLQERTQLAKLLKQLMQVREASAQKPPLFVKIAPDLTERQVEDVAEIALNANVQGLIIGNTTVTRTGNLPLDFAYEKGGLSGKPLFDLSTSMLALMYKLTQGKLPLIGTGGIASAADAYAKIRAGASLVQLYTALVFQGPGLVSRITEELADLLRQDGFKSVSEAVGKG
jgi:dihydroorotate dehydrogenase